MGYIRDLEEYGLDLREDFRDSKNGRLKLLAFDSANFLTGVAISGIGRLTNTPELIIGIPTLAWFMGVVTPPSHSPRAVRKSIYELGKYALGAAIPYADKIYLATQQYAPEINQTVQTLIDKF